MVAVIHEMTIVVKERKFVFAIAKYLYKKLSYKTK